MLCPVTWAATPHKPYHPKGMSKPKIGQPPFSFLPPHQPNATLSRLQATLTGRVVEHSSSPVPSSSATRPQYTQIFLNPEPVQAVTNSTAQSQVIQHQKMKVQAVASQTANLDYSLRSWVTDITTDQAKALAIALSTDLAQQNTPETTTLLLAVPHKKQRRNPFTPAFNDALRKAGFALVETCSQAKNTQIIQYQISRLDDGIWVKLRLPHSEVNRFYQLSNDHQLVATTPFSVRPMNPEGELK